MSSGITGVFLHVFSSLDDKKVDEITKEKVKLREMLEIATSHLKDCHFNQAKISFIEAKTYLKNCKKKDEMNLPDELDFYINIVIHYSFTMELDNVKDVTTEDFKKEDNSIRTEIDGLLKKYPKRHFPLFLRLLYSFKKECWREAIYFCDLVQNFKVFPEEEKKYKSTPIFSKNLIPELDIDYCNEVVHNIEEAAIYGLVEQLAKLDELKNPKALLAGFNWVNLWSKEYNEKIIKRLRSYKKPMNSFQLHKLFHSEILPKFYSLNKSAVGKSLFCYYKKEFMYQCEECLRARLQLESRNELFGRLCNNSSDENYSDDTDCFDTDDDEDDDDPPDSNSEDVLVLPPNSLEMDRKDKEATRNDKGETKEVPVKGKVEKSTIKKTSKSQQTQTDKMKMMNRYVQTECSIRKKSIAIQTDAPKTKKQEKIEKQEEIKCNKCTNNTKLFSVLDEIKNELSESKAEIKESMQDQLASLLKQIREENCVTKNQNEKNIDGSFEIIQAKENVAKFEKRILIMQDTFDKEKKDISEKNVFLQKLLIDQIHDKYMLYKNIYSGLENNCRVIITNVTELQSFVTYASIPNAKDNQLYLSRWEKTLVDLQSKNGQLKSFYKKAKSQMLHLSKYEFSDWPEIAEIPIEAFGFLFESLKNNVKNVGVMAGQQKLQNQKIIHQNNIPPMPNQPVQVPGQVYPVAVMPQNLRPYIGATLRYGTYQQPPPPIPMPPPKSRNAQLFNHWSQTGNPNSQMYPTSNQWTNSSNMAAFFKSFANAANNDVNNQKLVTSLNGSNVSQGNKSQNPNSANQDEENNAQQNLNSNPFWNIEKIDSYLNKNNEIKKREYHKAATNRSASENRQENMNMDDYFSVYNDFKTTSNNLTPNQSNQGDRVQRLNSGNQAAVNEQQRENLIQNGFWAIDTPCDNFCDVRTQAKDKSKNTAKEEETDDNHQELFQYLRTNCSDVDNDELISNILKVLKKFNGSFSNVPKTDILKEVRSSILTTKHGVWISPKSPLVDWEKDHADSHCSICFDDLSQRPKCVLPCKHEYHKDCISQWLRTNSICPICRVHSVIDEDYPPLA